ncbi:hypothetical protein QG37_00189 [Candidozyma auris]|nr:hypothetical protein QG37_00189 [[Candida] auris]
MAHDGHVSDELSVGELVFLRASDDAVQNKHVAKRQRSKDQDVLELQLLVVENLVDFEAKRSSREAPVVELVEPHGAVKLGHGWVGEIVEVEVESVRHWELKIVGTSEGAKGLEREGV